MAYPSSIFLVFALLCVTTTPLVHGLIINGNEIAAVRIVGRLVCSATGNPIAGVTNLPGLGGVNVLISCNGGQTNLGQLLTNANGFIDALLNVADGALFDPSQCTATVNLPLVSCTVSPPTGSLRAVVGLLNIVPSLVGRVAVFGIGLFQFVPL